MQGINFPLGTITWCSQAMDSSLAILYSTLGTPRKQALYATLGTPLCCTQALNSTLGTPQWCTQALHSTLGTPP